MDDPSDEAGIWIETVQIGGGSTRPISSGRRVRELVQSRQEDISNAIDNVSVVIRASLDRLPKNDDWYLDEFQANVGISLTAETGAFIAKAATTGTIGIKFIYKRNSSE